MAGHGLPFDLLFLPGGEELAAAYQRLLDALPPGTKRIPALWRLPGWRAFEDAALAAIAARDALPAWDTVGWAKAAEDVRHRLAGEPDPEPDDNP